MKEIILPNEMKVLIDDEDFEKVSQYSWHVGGFKKNSIHKTYYAVTNLPRESGKPRKKLAMHHLIMGEKRMINHIDHNGLNNQKNNLIFANHQDCQYNLYKDQGATYNPHAKKWESTIVINKEKIYLGIFNTKEEALDYRKEWMKSHDIRNK